jgi:hypothetical protein
MTTAAVEKPRTPEVKQPVPTQIIQEVKEPVKVDLPPLEQQQKVSLPPVPEPPKPAPFQQQAAPAAPLQTVSTEVWVYPQDKFAQALKSCLSRDTEIILPAQDCFSEELRVQILNSQLHMRQNMQLKVYSQQNYELKSELVQDQCCFAVTAN